jgi:glycosyltransferase involved in cell wall biosynthesis
LKVAFLTGGLPFGGTSNFLLNLTTGLRSLSVSSGIFSLTRENPFEAEFAASGIPTHLFDENALIIEDRLEALYRKLAEFNPTAVIINTGVEAYEIFRYLPKGIVRIGMIHDLVMNPGRMIPLYRDVLDGVAVVNAHLAEDVRRAAPAVNCRYLAHGIPLPSEAPRTANPDRPLKVIYFGRLEPGKGTRLFPEIIARLRQRKVPFQWTIHGTGPDETFLRETLAKEVAAGEVVLSSKVPRRELYPLIRQHDIFVMASEVEGGPLTLLEAMSLGLVPVCNEIPCLIQEVINPENGFRVSREPEAYAETIASLNHDRAGLEQKSIAARKAITSQYSAEAMARRYVDYITALAPSQSPAPWPAAIKIKPMRFFSAAGKMRSVGLFRPARRAWKRLGSKPR